MYGEKYADLFQINIISVHVHCRSKRI